ncbi:MAG: PAS domain S-box protein [Longimicrobiales bacterium]
MLVFAVGAALLFYERFTQASRWLFSLALVVSAWLLLFGAVYLAEEGTVARVWFKLGLALVVFTGPTMYGLALRLTGRRRPALMVGLWGGAAILALTAAGPLYGGLVLLLSGDGLAPAAWVGWAYVLYLAGAVAAVATEYATAYREATSRAEQRRHRTMLAATLVAAIGFSDLFEVGPLASLLDLAPMAMAASLAIMALAGGRFRAFSLSTRFGTDEVLRAIGDAVLVCDAAGVVRVANVAARRLLGARRFELIGSRLSRWLDDPLASLVGPSGGAGPTPADRPTVEDEGEEDPALPLASITGSIRDRELTLVGIAGERIIVSASVEPIRFGGRSAGAVIVARDIGPRLEAKRALEVSQRRYESLFWHNPAVMYEFDIEGRFVAANPTAEALFGRPVSEFRGRPFAEVIVPADVGVAEEVFEAVLAGESREYEIMVRTARGGRRKLRGVTIPIFEGRRVVGAHGVALDITEQDRIQHELEVQRRYFADLFNSSPEGIVLVDPGTDEVLRVNEEFTRMFGYTSEEVLGRKLTDLIVPGERADEGPELNRQARLEGRVRTETVRRRKDGSTIDVSVLARDIRIPGEPRQLYGVYRDITARKATERALQEREEELRHSQRLEAVGKLAGGVAHDFNNLLTVITGHARFALEGAEEDCRVVGELEEIERAGVRAAALTQQLLAYSRRQVLHPRVLDPNGVIRELQGMLRRLIGEHIRIETRYTDEEVRVRADRGQLEQVLVNLVVNARDAMADGGTLTLETDRLTVGEDDDRVERWDVEPGEFVRIRVTDDGKGMDPGTLDHAFEPFFTTKEQGRGTGLGLATVFGIVKQSDGHVTATSEPGVGTTVDVLLPRCHAEASDETAEARPRRNACPGGTVLVVEDEDAVRKLAVRALEKEGCTVLAAENGVRALEVVDRHHGPLDLVVTDLIMPDMGGRELADELRRRRPDLPVLFMSGYDDAMVSEGGGAADFLAKPFTPATLAARVAERMAR